MSYSQIEMSYGCHIRHELENLFAQMMQAGCPEVQGAVGGRQSLLLFFQVLWPVEDESISTLTT